MFQVGALGFMTITTIFFFIMNKKINLSQRLLMVRSMSLHERNGIVGLVRRTLFGTLMFESAGAVVLWIRFIPEYGVLRGFGMGAFHSVSALCNAGFELMGDIEPFSGLTAYSDDPVVMITTILLAVVGGIGFFVWEDIWRSRSFKKLHLHSKMVLSISFLLIIFGWVIYYFAERKNPGTIGRLPFADAALVSLFQSVMTRSCGFSVVDQASLTGLSKMTTMMLMFIGGSAGSAAGGIKNVTAGIVFLTATHVLRGKKRLTVFGRTIPEAQKVSALSIMVMALTACFGGTVAIALIQPELPFTSVLFEIVSAVATCGLSQGITPSLSFAASAIIIVSMFFGRVGIMTVGMAVFLRRNTPEATKRPDTWVMM